MKFLLYIAVIAATAWAGWFTHPQITAWMKERIDARLSAEEKKIKAAVNQEREKVSYNPGRTADLFNAIASRQTPAANPGTAPANPGTTVNPAATTPPPATTASNPPPPPVDEIDARYPMPTFKAIEEITKDWSAIPTRAFPRKVRTKVPLSFDAPQGKVELPADSEARAAGMVAGMLIVMREGDDTSRIQVPLANTDLKETLTSLYEKYKEYRRNLVIKQREHARALKARSNGATEEQMAKAGPKPEVRAGGVIPVMMEDIQSGKLTELKAESITSWGNLDYEEVDGTVYWTGTVQCTVENPLFGPQPTEVMALIKDNKVVKWIYTGSREPVQ